MSKLQVNTPIVVDYTEDGWAEFVKWLDGTYASLTYVWADEGLAYFIAAVDGSVGRVFSINKADATEFEASYKTTTPKAVDNASHQADGALMTAQAPRMGSETIKSTHNYCDPTTWWTESVGVTGETLVDAGNQLTFTSAHTNWINIVSGHIFEEDDIDTKYLVKVYIDAVEKTMRDPFASDWSGGGDYYVDFETGNVIFQFAQTGTVTADYYYAAGSSWYLVPYSGKALLLEKAEMQLGSDLEMTASLRYDIEINLGEGWFPYGSSVYKSTWQILMEARGAYPTVPVMGTGARGTGVSVIGFPFVYSTVRILSSSSPPTRIRCFVEGDTPFTGSHASGTFYCLSQVE